MLLEQLLTEIFKSKRQRRLFYAKFNNAKKSGNKKEMRKWNKYIEEFESDTPVGKKLPEKVK